MATTPQTTTPEAQVTEVRIGPDLPAPAAAVPASGNERLGYWEDSLPARPLAPPSPSGWYRVFTPLADWAGNRYGAHFEQGEAVVHTDQVIARPVPGEPDLRLRVVDLLVQDLGYRVEPIPAHEPPVPSYQLAQIAR